MLKQECLRLPFALWGIALILTLVLGTFFDYAVTDTLYRANSNPAVMFFEAFGKLPAFWLLSGAGLLCLRLVQKEKRWRAVLCIVVGMLAFAYSTYRCIMELMDDGAYISMTWKAVVIAVTHFAFWAALFRLTRHSDRRELFRFILIVFMVCLGTLVAEIILKTVWARPRMWILRSDDRIAFVPWWKTGRAQRDAFVAMGVDNHAFRSMPSGHTTCAACFVLISLLGTLNRKLNGLGPILFAVALTWTILAAFTRLSLGAHFLSDLAMSGILVFALFLLATWMFGPKSRLFNLAEKIVL